MLVGVTTNFDGSRPGNWDAAGRDTLKQRFHNRLAATDWKGAARDSGSPYIALAAVNWGNFIVRRWESIEGSESTAREWQVLEL